MLMTGELHSRHLVVIIRTESFDPCRDRRSCWFRQLELDRPLSLFLNHRSTGDSGLMQALFIFLDAVRLISESICITVLHKAAAMNAAERGFYTAWVGGRPSP